MSSRCSRHLTGNESQFIIVEDNDGGETTFGDNGKQKTDDLGNIQITLSTFIEYILLVNDLKYNLLRINQLCDKGFKVKFKSSHCIVTSSIDNGIKFTGHRHKNIYMGDLMIYSWITCDV